MNRPEPPADLDNLPVRGEGESGGYSWRFRGEVVGDTAREWITVEGVAGGDGHGGAGPLPFADVGYTVLGHIGSYGSSSGGWSRVGFFRREYRPATVSGVVSAAAAKVSVHFNDGSEQDAQLFDSGCDDVRFFFVIHNRKHEWTEIIVGDVFGNELERVRHKRDAR